MSCYRQLKAKIKSWHNNEVKWTDAGFYAFLSGREDRKCGLEEKQQLVVLNRLAGLLERSGCALYTHWQVRGMAPMTDMRRWESIKFSGVPDMKYGISSIGKEPS